MTANYYNMLPLQELKFAFPALCEAIIRRFLGIPDDDEHQRWLMLRDLPDDSDDDDDDDEESRRRLEILYDFDFQVNENIENDDQEGR